MGVDTKAVLVLDKDLALMGHLVWDMDLVEPYQPFQQFLLSNILRSLLALEVDLLVFEDY
jgi:hypothetical protein